MEKIEFLPGGEAARWQAIVELVNFTDPGQVNIVVIVDGRSNTPKVNARSRAHVELTTDLAVIMTTLGPQMWHLLLTWIPGKVSKVTLHFTSHPSESVSGRLFHLVLLQHP